jgi:hypothetical protein
VHPESIIWIVFGRRLGRTIQHGLDLLPIGGQHLLRVESGKHMLGQVANWGSTQILGAAWAM